MGKKKTKKNRLHVSCTGRRHECIDNFHFLIDPVPCYLVCRPRAPFDYLSFLFSLDDALYRPHSLDLISSHRHGCPPCIEPSSPRGGRGCGIKVPHAPYAALHEFQWLLLLCSNQCSIMDLNRSIGFVLGYAHEYDVQRSCEGYDDEKQR